MFLLRYSLSSILLVLPLTVPFPSHRLPVPSLFWTSCTPTCATVLPVPGDTSPAARIVKRPVERSRGVEQKEL